MRKYFGHVDASAEDMQALNSHFVSHELFTEIIGPDNSDGAQIIVGLKGAGKTALGRVAIERFDGIQWFCSEKSKVYRFQVPKNVPRSGILMKMIRVFIIEQFVEQLLSEKTIEKEDLEKIVSALKGLGAKVAKSTEVNAGLLKIDPAKFFSVDIESKADSAWETAISLLKEKAESKNMFIVLDDVDTYFSGLEEEPRFIEGLCRAVIEINSIDGLNLYCVLLVKQGVWRTLFAKPDEYDKIKYCIEFLSWDIHQCAAVLCGRIAEIHELDFEPPQTLDVAIEYLKRDFAGSKKDIKNCFESIFEYSANGPRDVIDLCNSVKRKYPSSRIDISKLQERIPNYSEEKLNGINADYGHIYPDMPGFLLNAFQSFRAKFKGKLLAVHLEGEDGILTDPRSERQAFGQHDWFKDATSDGMVKVLFDIGVVGIVRSNRPALFSNEDSSISQNQLGKSTLVVHKSFQSALGLA